MIRYPKSGKQADLLRFTLTQGAQDNWAAGGEKNSLGIGQFFQWICIL